MEYWKLSGMLAAALASGLAQGAEGDAGKWLFEARWRLENVDDAAFARDAEADTLRLRLGYRTPCMRAGAP